MQGLEIEAVYEHGNRYNHEPMRNRKLLLHKKEIDQLLTRIATKGLTLIPLKLYLKNGKAKVELGLCRGKKLYDKREAIAKRDAQRDIERIVRGPRRRAEIRPGVGRPRRVRAPSHWRLCASLRRWTPPARTRRPPYSR